MTVSDKINRMIEIALSGAKITSASPGHVNSVFLLEEMDHSDLESEIRTIVDEEVSLQGTQKSSSKQKADDEFLSEKTKLAKELLAQKKELEKQRRDLKKDLEEIKQLKKEVEKTDENREEQLKKLDKAAFQRQEELKTVQEELTKFETTSLKDLQSLTSEQVSNLNQMTKDPFQFFLSKFFKKFAKGAGIVALAAIIAAAVQLIISELLKPGRLLDRRFKRIASDEILLFNSTETQAELRQGFRTVTVTTIPFLKGSDLRGQISGNLYNPTAVPMNRLDPRRTIAPPVESQSGSRASKFANRRNSRFG